MLGITRREMLLVGALLLIGVGLRIGKPDHLGIDHFDEGVYASHVPPGPRGITPYPLRHLYAPSFVPWIQNYAQSVSRHPTTAPNLAGVVAGCLTLVAIWWVGRCWFGPLAGTASLALAATSDFHATFSRSALTDPWFLLWLILAVAFVERTLRRHSLLDLLVASFFTALAWWTKYNGWLPLAIGVAGWAAKTTLDFARPLSVPPPPDAARPAPTNRRRAVSSPAPAPAESEPTPSSVALSSIISLAAIGLLAGTLFYPYIYLLQADDYSYSEISANHGKYVGGLLDWWPSFARQLANLRWFDGLMTTVASPLALGLIAACEVAASRRLVVFVAIAGPYAIASMLLGSFPSLLLLGSVAIAIALLSLRNEKSQSSLRTWAKFLWAAWFLGLFVATPFYHPYARLTLPLLAAAWLGAGWLFAQLVPKFSLSAESQHAEVSTNLRRERLLLIALASTCVIVLGLSWPRLIATGLPSLRDRGSLGRASIELFREVYSQVQRDSREPRPEAVFLTYGEPAVYFALSLDDTIQYWDELALAPAGHLPEERLDRPLFLVTGPHSEKDEALHEAIARTESPRYELVASQAFRPSDILLLDLFDPRTLDRKSLPELEIRCYRAR